MKPLFYCLVPAKGISKSIPKKNLSKIKGKSLVELAVLSVQKNKYIKEIFVSSEDPKILAIAKKLKINPIKRSKKLSIGDIEPKFLVLEFLKKTRYIRKIDYIVYLQPTSPMRKSQHITSAIKEIINKNKNSLTSVVKADNKILKSLILRNNKLYSVFKESNMSTSRQKLKNIYLPNGAIYIFRVSEFLKNNNFPVEGSLSFLMSQKSSIDIDTLDDLKKAKNELRN